MGALKQIEITMHGFKECVDKAMERDYRYFAVKTRSTTLKMDCVNVYEHKDLIKVY